MASEKEGISPIQGRAKMKGTKQGDASGQVKCIRPNSWARLKIFPDIQILVQLPAFAVHRRFPLLNGMICDPLNKTIIV